MEGEKIPILRQGVILFAIGLQIEYYQKKINKKATVLKLTSQTMIDLDTKLYNLRQAFEEKVIVFEKTVTSIEVTKVKMYLQNKIYTLK